MTDPEYAIVIGILSQVFDKFKKQDSIRKNLYIGYEYFTQQPLDITVDQTLDRIIVLPHSISKIHRTELRDLKERTTARIDLANLQCIQVCINPCRSWRVTWDSHNLDVLNQTLKEHMEVYEIEESFLFPKKDQLRILNEINPSCYHHLMLIALIFTSYNHPEYGYGSLEKYMNPPAEFDELYRLLPNELVYPFFYSNLLMVLKRAYLIDHAMASKILDDLRLGNSTDYILKVIDYQDYDPSILNLISKIRYHTVPDTPYMRFAEQLQTS
jgi:hypothetical protein